MDVVASDLPLSISEPLNIPPQKILTNLTHLPIDAVPRSHVTNYLLPNINIFLYMKPEHHMKADQNIFITSQQCCFG